MLDCTTVPTNYKKCSKCGAILPATSEYFYSDKSVKSGLRAECKTCKKKAIDHWNKEHPNYHRDYQRQWCKENYERNRKNWVLWCEKNKDKQIAWRQHYHQKNKHQRNEKSRRWYQEHKNRRQQYERRRRVARDRRNRNRIAPGKHTPEDIRQQYKKQEGKCYWCDTAVGDTYHIDHVIPLARGGSNNPDNLVISCPACNLSKGSKLPSEWSGSNGKA